MKQFIKDLAEALKEEPAAIPMFISTVVVVLAIFGIALGFNKLICFDTALVSPFIGGLLSVIVCEIESYRNKNK